MPDGVVLVSFGASCLVETEAGELVRCATRRRTGRPVCGDRVTWTGRPPGECVVERILDRRNTLLRTNYRGQAKPLAANLEGLGIVIAPEPPPDHRLIDRYLVLARSLDVAPMLIVNKADLGAPDGRLAGEAVSADAAAHGCTIHTVSTHTGEGLDGLSHALENGATLLVGQSGVGKSSLINRLVPDRQARTQAISEASGQGRHTTTETTLYPLPGGGCLMDSPGVRILRLGHLRREAIQEGFPEIAAIAPACAYRDCTHQDEPDCAVRRAAREGRIPAGRLGSFHELLAERNAS